VVRLERHEFDTAYIQRLIAGDSETEAHFTRYFRDLLALKLRRRLRSAAQIEDATQETFVRVLSTLKQKGGLTTAASLGAFVNGVCNNVLFETYRANARSIPMDDEFDQTEPRPGIETTLIATEEHERVREALQGLPRREKDLLTWLFFEGRDKDAICRDMQIDRNYLRVLLHRARKQFRDRFLLLSSR
jgi:RNA polymerase sigma-70 factor, ECF subfamily